MAETGMIFDEASGHIFLDGEQVGSVKERSGIYRFYAANGDYVGRLDGNEVYNSAGDLMGRCHGNVYTWTNGDATTFSGTKNNIIIAAAVLID